MRSQFLFAAAALLLLGGCKPAKPAVWIYTSLYKEVIAEMKPLVDAAVPEADIQWFQGGSENVAAKFNAEAAGGGSQADLLLTSDPFWYLELKNKGMLLAYDSPAARGVSAKYADPDHAFVTVRIPAMVIGYNLEALKSAELPRRWKDLSAERWKGRLSMGSPLESGTSFTSVAMLSRSYGWDYFAALRKLELIAAGGNGSVITRLETKERPVGIVLLENILKAQAKGSPVGAVYPEEGVIPVPSPIAILKATRNPELAKKVYDWFFSEQAQKAIVKGGMYSPLPGLASPEGAKPWSEVGARAMKWDAGILSEILAKREEIKTKFSEAVLR